MPSSSCVKQLPSFTNPVNHFARELIREANVYIAKVAVKERTLMAAIQDAKFDMDNSTTKPELDAADIVCQNRIKEVERLAAEATALVGQVDLSAIGNIFSSAQILTAAERNAGLTLETHQAVMLRTRNYIEMAVEHVKYTIACLTAYARYETNESALEYHLCRAHLIGDLDMDVVPDSHEEMLQKVRDEETEARKEAQRVLIEAGNRLGFPVGFGEDEEEDEEEEDEEEEDEEEEDEEEEDEEEDEEQAGWEDDREWDDENNRWK